MKSPATCWELLPPGAPPGYTPPNDPGEIQDRWRECFANLDDLANRLAWLAWGVADPDEEGGRNEGDDPPASQARKDLDETTRKELMERIEDAPPQDESSQADLEKLHADDLRRVFPVPKGLPFRRWGPGVIPSLRVRGPGEVECAPWYSHSDILSRVLDLIPMSGPEQALRSAIKERCRDEARDASHSGLGTSDSKPILIKDEELRAVIAAMLTRPLVLLAGISGSGKTQVAKRLGKAWAAGMFEEGLEMVRWPSNEPPEKAIETVMGKLKGEVISKDPPKEGWWAILDIPGDPSLRARYAFTAVQSDWTDASHLWGFHVPLPAEAEGFYGTAALRVFLDADRAWRKAGTPASHFVLLDEMNLSRPEHYGSDLLSAMEVQHGSDAKSDVIQLHRAGRPVRLRGAAASGDDASAWVPERIGWTRGLLVIGTVNVDETTFSFAPKVLDRAALLEFVDIDLKVVFGSGAMGVPEKALYEDNEKFFKDLETALKPYNLHLGYRAAKEILDALALAGKDKDTTLDRQLCNKVLPRIRGPRASVEGPLIALLGVIGDTDGGKPWDEQGVHHHLQAKKPDSSGGAWPTSRKKIWQMLRRAHEIGFTSYFG